MEVSEVLKHKSKNKTVEVTSPDVTIASASTALVERAIGSLVVCDDAKRVLGILTERDIVQGISDHGEAALTLKASELMSRAVICTPKVAVDQIMRVMTNERVRHLVVMVGDRIEGVVSIGDVVNSRLDQCELEVNVLRDYSRVRGVAARGFA